MLNPKDISKVTNIINQLSEVMEHSKEWGRKEEKKLNSSLSYNNRKGYLQSSLLFWKDIVDYLVTRSQQKVLDSL